MSEPKSILAGTKITWSREVAGAELASYQYVLLSESEKLTIDANYSDNELTVLVTTSTSASYMPGHYTWYLIETLEGEKQQIAQGRLEIKADPTAAAAAQVLTHNEKMLASIRKRLEGRILSDHENYSIEGRSLSRIPVETLTKLERDYAWKVYNEQVTRGERQRRKSIRYR